MAKTILDRFGNPIEIGKIAEQQTARLGALHHEFATHPSNGLTPWKLASILRDAEQGDLAAQCDLFEDMEEKDGHIFAELSKRKRALLTIDWDIVPPPGASDAEKKTAAAIKEIISDIPDFDDVLLDALDAIGKGFSCQEIEWRRAGAAWIPATISHRPPTWFNIPADSRNELRLRDNSANGEALQPLNWIVHRHKAKSGYLARGGLHRVLAWPYLFKNYSVRDLAEFLEIYGLPLRLGSYPSGASDSEKATLLRAVVDIGHRAAGIIPAGMGIEFKEAAKGNKDPFEAMIEWCERTQSKAILGGTLTSQADGKSSTNALGNVHNEVRHDLLVSDARQIEGSLSRDLVFPIGALNFAGTDPRRAPRFVLDTREKSDIELLAEAYPKLVGIGVKIPRAYAHEQLGIPEPGKDEDILEVAAGAPAAARLAAAKADDTVQDEFDEFAAELADDWERTLGPLVEPILAAAREATSYEEFNAELIDIARTNPEALTELLARGQFATRIWGRLNAGKD